MFIRKIVKIWNLYKNVWYSMVWRWNYFILTMKSLLYNEFLSPSYCLESALTPVFWFIEHFAKYFGCILVTCVVILTSSVVTVIHIIGIPYYWTKSAVITLFIIVIGLWFIVNIIFHFYMGVTTDPGSPENSIVSQTVTICKKCISPKPPRTHHCSVCNRCILKMDHHCPWLNNCVGHFNHRHFFMYMVYMVFGSFFVMILGFEIFYNEIWHGGEDHIGWGDALYYKLGWLEVPSNDYDYEEITGTPVVFNKTHIIPKFNDEYREPLSLIDNEPVVLTNSWRHFFIMYASMFTTAAFLSLFALTAWHTRRISRGETSIENLINNKEIKRLAEMDMVYKNPYDFGFRTNWRIFFGLTDKRGWWYILFPSNHPPFGDGLTWPINQNDKIA